MKHICSVRCNEPSCTEQPWTNPGHYKHILRCCLRPAMPLHHCPKGWRNSLAPLYCPRPTVVCCRSYLCSEEYVDAFQLEAGIVTHSVSISETRPSQHFLQEELHVPKTQMQHLTIEKSWDIGCACLFSLIEVIDQVLSKCATLVDQQLSAALSSAHAFCHPSHAVSG